MSECGRNAKITTSDSRFYSTCCLSEVTTRMSQVLQKKSIGDNSSRFFAGQMSFTSPNSAKHDREKTKIMRKSNTLTHCKSHQIRHKYTDQRLIKETSNKTSDFVPGAAPAKGHLQKRKYIMYCNAVRGISHNHRQSSTIIWWSMDVQWDQTDCSLQYFAPSESRRKWRSVDGQALVTLVCPTDSTSFSSVPGCLVKDDLEPKTPTAPPVMDGVCSMSLPRWNGRSADDRRGAVRFCRNSIRVVT